MSGPIDYTSFATWKHLKPDDAISRLAETAPGVVDSNTAEIAQNIFAAIKENLRTQVFVNCEKLGLRGHKMFKAYSYCEQDLNKFIVAVLNEDEAMITASNNSEMVAKKADYTKLETWQSMDPQEVTNRLATLESGNIETNASVLVNQMFRSQRSEVRAQVFLNCELLGLRGPKLFSAYTHCGQDLSKFVVAVLNNDEAMLDVVKVRNDRQLLISASIEDAATVREQLFAMINVDVNAFKANCTKLELCEKKLYELFLLVNSDYEQLIQKVLNSDESLENEVKSMKVDNANKLNEEELDVFRAKLNAKLNEKVTEFKAKLEKHHLWSWRLHFAFIHCGKDYNKLLKAILNSDKAMIEFLRSKEEEFFPSKI